MQGELIAVKDDITTLQSSSSGGGTLIDTTDNLYFVVNSITGDDSNIGNDSFPFATLERAIEELKKYRIAHNVSLNLDGGGTWDLVNPVFDFTGLTLVGNRDITFFKYDGVILDPIIMNHPLATLIVEGITWHLTKPLRLVAQNNIFLNSFQFIAIQAFGTGSGRGYLIELLGCQNIVLGGNLFAQAGGSNLDGGMVARNSTGIRMGGNFNDFSKTEIVIQNGSVVWIESANFNTSTSTNKISALYSVVMLGSGTTLNNQPRSITRSLLVANT